MIDQESLDKLVLRTASKRSIHGAAFAVGFDDGQPTLVSAAGEMGPDSPYYIASINKLMVSASILQMAHAGQLSLDDPISKFFATDVLNGIHVFKGTEYSARLTIKQLLSHTSGLPCYLINKGPDGRKVMDSLRAGNDQAWPLERVLGYVKTQKPLFAPDTKGKANYANTNHHMLCHVISSVAGEPVAKVFAGMFAAVGMENTYVISNKTDMDFVPFYVKAYKPELPEFFISSGYDVVSTVADQVLFLKAFFGGKFFPKDWLPGLEQWNNIFFPFRYGIGVQQFYMPRILSPFSRLPKMVGHCGSTGTVAFYLPEKGAYITGTVNQSTAMQTVFQTMVRIGTRI